LGFADSNCCEGVPTAQLVFSCPGLNQLQVLDRHQGIDSDRLGAILTPSGYTPRALPSGRLRCPNSRCEFVEQDSPPQQELQNQKGPTMWTLCDLVLPRGFEPLLPP
jgi:hypothetical protein